MGPVEVAISPGVPGQRITYAIVATGASVEPAWLPNGKPVVPEELLPAAESSASCSWLEYTGPLQIGESTTLLVRGASAGAIRQLAHEEYHFSLPQVPTADTATLPTLEMSRPVPVATPGTLRGGSSRSFESVGNGSLLPTGQCGRWRWRRRVGAGTVARTASGGPAGTVQPEGSRLSTGLPICRIALPLWSNIHVRAQRKEQEGRPAFSGEHKTFSLQKFRGTTSGEHFHALISPEANSIRLVNCRAGRADSRVRGPGAVSKRSGTSGSTSHPDRRKCEEAAVLCCPPWPAHLPSDVVCKMAQGHVLFVCHDCPVVCPVSVSLSILFVCVCLSSFLSTVCLGPRSRQVVLDDIVTTIDAQEVITIAHSKRKQLQMELTGFLRAEKAGIYQIFFRPDHGGLSPAIGTQLLTLHPVPLTRLIVVCSRGSRHCAWGRPSSCIYSLSPEKTGTSRSTARNTCSDGTSTPPPCPTRSSCPWSPGESTHRTLFSLRVARKLGENEYASKFMNF